VMILIRDWVPACQWEKICGTSVPPWRFLHWITPFFEHSLNQRSKIACLSTSICSKCPRLCRNGEAQAAVHSEIWTASIGVRLSEAETHGIVDPDGQLWRTKSLCGKEEACCPDKI
jgi:hypothetical protein